MKADKAATKFQPLDALRMKEQIFFLVITSRIRYRLDNFSEKFLIIVLSGCEVKRPRHYGCRN